MSRSRATGRSRTMCRRGVRDGPARARSPQPHDTDEEQSHPIVWIDIPAIVALIASHSTSPTAISPRGGPASAMSHCLLACSGCRWAWFQEADRPKRRTGRKSHDRRDARAAGHREEARPAMPAWARAGPLRAKVLGRLHDVVVERFDQRVRRLSCST